MSYPDSAKTIWNYFMQEDKINNAYGVAGLMGNLQAESGLYCYRVQGDFTKGYTYSLAYTNKVDSRNISENEFVYHGPNGGGYGLAQWTSPGRKQALYTKYSSGGYSSIGDVHLACDYLWEELSADYFKPVLTACQNATDVETPSNAVLHKFENPGDQSESVETARAKLGNDIYKEFCGTPITPETPETSSLYISSKLSTPYIFRNGVWQIAIPHMYHNGAWICGDVTESKVNEAINGNALNDDAAIDVKK